MMGGMMNGFGFGGFGSYGLLGMILNLVITIGSIAAIVLLVAWLIRRLGQDRGASFGERGAEASGLSAHEIVQLRYARGELTREQYREILADLG